MSRPASPTKKPTMSRPSSPTKSLPHRTGHTDNNKLPWINRQFHKISDKVCDLCHKNHPETKNKLDSAGVPTGNGSISDGEGGKEVGFNAFGKENVGLSKDEAESKPDVNMGPSEWNAAKIPGPYGNVPAVEKDIKHVETAQEASGSGSGSGVGTDAKAETRTTANVPTDGEDIGEGGLTGEIGPHTALNSHPVSGLFR